MARNTKKTRKTETAQVETGEGTAVETSTVDDGSEIAAIEAMLNEDGDTTEQTAGADAEIDPDELEASIEAEDAKGAAYAEQESKGDVADEEDVSETEQKAKKGAKPQVAGSKGAGRTTNVHTDPVSAVRAPFGSDPIVLDSEEGEVDAATFDATISGLQKKVKEKAANLAQHVAQGKKLSVYTEIALRVVLDKLDAGEDLGSKDFKAAYLAKGLAEGTANAQAGQMMTLLPAFKIVERKGSTLTPNPNSTILDALR